MSASPADRLDWVPTGRFKWIDEASRSQHWALDPDDHCLFLGEYRAGGGWTAGMANSLVLNFKRTPSRILASPHAAAVGNYKRRAISAVAGALRGGFSRAAVESLLTFVPIPASRLPGDADYCDRLLRALHQAFEGWDADIRPLLRQRASAIPDHARADRLSRRALLQLMEVDGASPGRPLRPLVALFDDVLTSGKHLRVAKARILERFPHQAIIAVVVARVARPEEVAGEEPSPCARQLLEA
ncbi:MAG: hypothetical protein ACREUG_03000 [Steroidobacteraceae bacterium]